MSMNFNEAKQLIKVFRNANVRLAPLLYGHTGIGKTELVKELCEELEIDCLVLHVAQLEPSDFIGLYKINADYRTDTCPPSWLPYKTVASKERAENMETLNKMVSGQINPNGGILFLDEVNRGHEDIKQAMYELVNDLKIHTYKLPPKYSIVAAANPTQGYETYEFDPALINRFAWVEFIPEKKESIAYLNNKYKGSPVAAWISGDPDKLVISGDHLSMEDAKQLTPRMLEHIIKVYDEMVKEKCSNIFINKTLETMMKKMDVNAFVAFQKEMEMVPIEAIFSGDEAAFKKLEEYAEKKRLDIFSVLCQKAVDFANDYKFDKPRTKAQDTMMKSLERFLMLAPTEFTMTFVDACARKKYYIMKDGKKVEVKNPATPGVIVEDNPNCVLYQPEFEVPPDGARCKPLLQKIGMIKDVFVETNSKR